MADRNKKIAAQLRALADSMEHLPDDELLPTILDACGGLMTAVADRRPPAVQMDPIDLAGYTAGYSAISAQVGHFAQDLRSVAPPEAEGVLLKDAMAELERLRAVAAEDRAKRQHTEDLIHSQQQTNDALKAQIKDLQADLKKLEDFHKTLIYMAQACTPEAIAQQDSENSALLRSITEQTSKLKALEGEQARLDHELEEVRRKIAGVQTTIDALPREQVRLLAEYDAKLETLRRLENAQTECSPENQEKLTAQIEALTPLVEQQEGQIGKLRNHYDQLFGAKIELDRERQVLETDLLDLLQSSLGELTLLMEEHRQTLTQVRKDADTYRESLAECKAIRDGYSEWFASDRMHLDAMIQALERQENMELSTTLCVSKEKKIQKLLRDVEEALQELDRLLLLCAQAARLDLAKIERQAGGK